MELYELERKSVRNASSSDIRIQDGFSLRDQIEIININKYIWYVIIEFNFDCGVLNRILKNRVISDSLHVYKSKIFFKSIMNSFF